MTALDEIGLELLTNLTAELEMYVFGRRVKGLLTSIPM